MDPFLFEAFNRICSSLSIEQSLGRAFEHLRQRLPADGAFINIYIEPHQSIRFLARADAHGAQALRQTIDVPPTLAAGLDSQQRPRLIRVDDIRDDPVTQHVATQIIPDIASFLMLRMELDSCHLGVVTFYSRAPAAFAPVHEALLVQLHDPFALVTAYALHPILREYATQLRQENARLQSALGEARCAPLARFLDTAPGLSAVAEKMAQAAPYDATVLITGETGSGKEVVANTIHQLSGRAGRPFVKVNCGAIPEGLIDSELFGHEKGAFTDARQARRGFFEQADGGTLFLDEVGELTPAAQLRLLRTLQHKTITRVGGSDPITLDVRIIAATHRPLEALVWQGEFRQDLWYRLNVFPIEVPPLRERSGDIAPLSAYFLAALQRKYRLPVLPRLADETLQAACAYDWPGNVRELENLLERAVLQGQGMQNEESIHLMLPMRAGQSMPAATARRAGVESLDAVTRAHLQQVLRLCGGKIAGKGGAAERVGLHPNTLRSRMEKLGILVPRAHRRSFS